MTAREKLKAAILEKHNVSEEEADRVIDELLAEEKSKILIEEREKVSEDRIKARAKRAAGI